MQEDFYQTERVPGINYGIYYHHGLIGSGPHMAQAVPPWKTQEIFSAAGEKNTHYYAIMNVGNVREFILGIEASRDMLEQMDGFDGKQWLLQWCHRNFDQFGTTAYEAYEWSHKIYWMIREKQPWNGILEVKIEELKSILGIEDKYEKRYDNFKIRVLRPAQEELKGTWAEFDFKEVRGGKGGREVLAITFLFRSDIRQELRLQKDLRFKYEFELFNIKDFM